MKILDEKALLHRLAHGDEAALTAIYHHYWQPLFLSAYQVLKDKKACEDIVQNLFLQLWLKREHLQVHASLKSYLLAATRYQVFHYLKNRPETIELPEALAMRFTLSTSDQSLLQKDLSQRVKEVVASLPQQCRLIYQLSREEHLSHKEISERLHLSPKTVENQITIALRRLRHSLQEWSVTSVLLLTFFLL